MPLTPLYTYFTQIAASNSAERLGASRLLLVLLASNLAFSQYSGAPALAQGDWGYEDKTTVSPDKTAPALPALPASRPSATEKAKVPAKTLAPAKILVPAKELAPAKPAVLKKPQVEASGPIVTLDDSRCWLELFALCASSSNEDDRKEVLELATLSLEQKNRLGKLVESKLKAPNNSWVGVAAIWKPLRPRILKEMDVKESYRLLFRALIRHQLSKVQESSADIELLQDLLGAVRIADPGPPVLTEDAVNAYSDMTCFLYQKRKPDRSVDGDDNRQTFALVIKDRFVRAPNLAAKTAMTNFDLTWACFRCRFLDVSDDQQEKLSALMASGDSKSSAQLKAELVSPTMLKIFALGPWSEKAKELKEERAKAEKLEIK